MAKTAVIKATEKLFAAAQRASAAKGMNIVTKTTKTTITTKVLDRAEQNDEGTGASAGWKDL